MTGLFPYLTEGGLLPAFSEVAAAFGEEVFVVGEEMEETDFAGGEAEEDHAGAFDELGGEVLGCWEAGRCHEADLCAGHEAWVKYPKMMNWGIEETE